MPEPPCGTVLYALDIPPHGGNTEFSNQHLSYESMPDDMRERFDGLQAIHSPKLGYSPKGAYGNVEENGAMDIKPSEEAEHMYHRILAPEHPETGRKGFLSGVSYIVGFEGMSDEDAYKFIFELNDWLKQTTCTATSGKKTCWFSGTIGALFTEQPVATRATGASYIVSPSIRGR